MLQVIADPFAALHKCHFTDLEPTVKLFDAMQQIVFAMPQDGGKYPVTAYPLFSTLATN
ncbi:hypothetical protein [Bordetella sp. BOR01]|uniref:hypothetical protein n=1 Tax=Bordetella sp. BOR01 TaxID=2854779 RepID=UPI001C44DE5A|nr:hypothetical protein [Bordetella sp. BOR01]MBV7481661.1 hypothetical protein [Bordetella sp. BOR01]